MMQRKICEPLFRELYCVCVFNTQNYSQNLMLPIPKSTIETRIQDETLKIEKQVLNLNAS